MIARIAAVLITLLVPIIVHAQGTIVVWGGSCEIPEPNEGYVDIVCSVRAWDHGYFFLALRENGSIEAWGDNAWGQCDVPEGYDDFVAIDAGVAHALALRPDGSVVVWGRPDCGACDVPDDSALSRGRRLRSGVRRRVRRVSGEVGRCGPEVHRGGSADGVAGPYMLIV